MTVTTGPPVHGGYVLARPEGSGVLFVRWALPGEVVSVRIVGRKREYAFAEAVEVLSPSPRRVDPPCEVFGECGGCQLQHADYPFQLEMKREILREAFRRIGKMDVAPEIAPPLEPFGYRYRGRLRVDGEAVGFHALLSHRLVAISRCPLMIDAINAVLPGLRGLGRFAKVSVVQVASDGVRASASFPGVPFGAEMVEHLSGRTGGVLSGARFEDRSWGEERITLRLDGMSYSVSPGGFFQANWRMNQSMVRRIGAALGDRGVSAGARLLDLYAGAGNFALPLAARVREVVAVEGEARSFRELRENVRENAPGNVRIVRSSVESFRPEGRFEALVLDPPRAGLSGRALARVREIAAGNVLYVSCDPATLARDVRSLSDRYDLASLEMHDFFPNTHHVEALAVLSAR
ncbi:class I SAM-dependent RNA methyltransferase [Candidatus Deferrimicrobium sp.]|uniref:class I SAM-dependent RNA methyltransferase n=1 Tax=Candidatus Deferrimicrobium sp. TaxID=3060586 RepID=UPI003C412B5B